MTTLKALINDTLLELEQLETDSPEFWRKATWLMNFFSQLPDNLDGQLDATSYVERFRLFYALFSLQVEKEILRYGHKSFGSPVTWESTDECEELRTEKDELLKQLFALIPEGAVQKLSIGASGLN